ncbi:Type I Polyketide synthases (Type I PKS) [Penicillium herquei]|nr:Type I Polyketide synthases (Type I PKS) [Penicillium herquei]
MGIGTDRTWVVGYSLHDKDIPRSDAPANVWKESWRRQEYLIQHSIDQLKQGVHTGQPHQIRRGLAYKIFPSVVQYGPQFHGMKEIAFESTGLEATAKIQPLTQRPSPYLESKR